jgi:hypothetical protein
VIYRVAGASLFIYLLHYHVDGLVTRLAPSPLVSTVLAVAVGVLGWKLWNMLTTRIRQHLSGLKTPGVATA